MEKKYTKLSELVGKTFTVEKAWGYQWKKWDEASKRMLVEDRWEEGFSKRYSVDTDQGSMEISAANLKDMLEAAYSKGESNIVGKTFSVKSNGKEGKEIRYYINLAKQTKEVVTDENVQTSIERGERAEDQINLGDVPF